MLLNFLQRLFAGFGEFSLIPKRLQAVLQSHQNITIIIYDQDVSIHRSYSLDMPSLILLFSNANQHALVFANIEGVIEPGYDDDEEKQV